MMVRSATPDDAPSIVDLAHRAHRSAVASTGLHELEVSQETVEWGISSPGLYWYVAKDEDQVVGYLALQRNGPSVVVFSMRTESSFGTDEVVEGLLSLAASVHGTAQFFLDVDPSLTVWFESRYQIGVGTRYVPFDPAHIPARRDRTPIGPWEPGAAPMAAWSPARPVSRQGAQGDTASTHRRREQHSAEPPAPEPTQQPPTEAGSGRRVARLWSRARR